MPSTPLPLVEKSCGIGLEEGLPAVLARRVSLDQMLTFCRFYRRMAIAKLLMSGVPDDFFEDLSRSARAFLYYLEGKDDAAKATGKADPFFDAVACGDMEAAAGIAKHARATWNEAKEYEEDFLYLWFLMKRFAARTSAADLDAILRRWADVIQGEEDSRLELCRAFQSRDAGAAGKALEAIAAGRAQETRKLLADERVPPDDVPTTAKVSVELLALLRLAELAGLATEAHLPLAPSVARQLDRAKIPPPDSWRDVPPYRELA